MDNVELAWPVRLVQRLLAKPGLWRHLLAAVVTFLIIKPCTWWQLYRFGNLVERYIYEGTTPEQQEWRKQQIHDRFLSGDNDERTTHDRDNV